MAKIDKGEECIVSAAMFFQRKRVIVLLAVLCTFLWGCAYPAVKLGYRLLGIPSGDMAGQMVFAGLRFSLAGIAGLILSLMLRRKMPLPAEKSQWNGILLLGILQTGIQYFFFYVGLAHTTGVRGSIFNTTSTFMTVLLTGVVLRKTDPLTPRKLVGCGLGLSGAVLINLNGPLAAPFTLLGDGFVLLSAASLAVGALLTKTITRKIDPLLLTGWQLFVGGALLLGAGLALGGRITQWSGKAAALLAFMVFISTAAFTLWTYLLKYNQVSSITVFNSLVPIFGVTLSGLVLGEAFLSPTSLAALALVCLGIFIVNYAKKEK